MEGSTCSSRSTCEYGGCVGIEPEADSLSGLLGFQGNLESARYRVEVHSLTPPSSTGSAGLIQTIQAFKKPSLPAAIVGTVATVGWVVQGVGLAHYYRQVGRCVLTRRVSALMEVHARHQIWAHHNAAGHSVEKVCAVTYRGSELRCTHSQYILAGKGRACFARRKGVPHARIDCCSVLYSLESSRSVVCCADSCESYIFFRFESPIPLDVIYCLYRKDCLKPVPCGRSAGYTPQTCFC